MEISKYSYADNMERGTWKFPCALTRHITRRGTQKFPSTITQITWKEEHGNFHAPSQSMCKRALKYIKKTPENNEKCFLYFLKTSTQPDGIFRNQKSVFFRIFVHLGTPCPSGQSVSFRLVFASLNFPLAYYFYVVFRTLLPFIFFSSLFEAFD